MDLELANGDKKSDITGIGFRDLREDREMAAYASVIYMIHAFSGVLPPDYIEVMETYICQKFPILNKTRNLDVILELCTPEVKEEISILREQFISLTRTSFTSTQALSFLKEKIKNFKPVHEEDLLVKSVAKKEDDGPFDSYLKISNPMNAENNISLVSEISDLFKNNLISPQIFDPQKSFIFNINGDAV